MNYLELTLTTPAENLALDEALLTSVDSIVGAHGGEGAHGGDTAPTSADLSSVAAESPALQAVEPVLRIWRAAEPFVVLGRSSQVAREVRLERAQQLGIPIFRRMSGGASVVLAPGCLLYSLLLRLDTIPRMRMLDVAHQFVMSRVLEAIRSLEPRAKLDGTCDLTLQGQKFSGNSLRIGRHWMLYHGTLLLNMQLSLIDELLLHPPREPEYRAGRPHQAFIANLGLDEAALIEALRNSWQAWNTMQSPPITQIQALVREKYGSHGWNFQR